MIQEEEKIRRYWDERAANSAGSPDATTNDVHLRRLEIATLIRVLKDAGLPPGARVLDVGCGDGYSTLLAARALPEISFFGMDYSPQMVENARARLAGEPDLADRVRFGAGDVTALDQALGGQTFDAAYTMRCLINLTSSDKQATAVGSIAAHIRPGGLLASMENFMEGQEAMNRARSEMGLGEIPVRWHNLFFTEAGFAEAAAPFFTDVLFTDFSSSYYFATRVIYSAMAKMTGEAIDYDHPIHRLAVDLPPTGRFSPVRLVTAKRKGDAE
ncbi:MAG: class I SAM-dependent methyltransferase [Proteobacteria bacterium]|nr:class I SAM-dependent methyltransferase [Pseudomonadota bacterium]